MGKLHRIRLHNEDQVRGNYILMKSGAVTHIPPDHHYLVDEEQMKLLNEEGIRYFIAL